MKLYASPASSFARKIRIMLIEKNVGQGFSSINDNIAFLRDFVELC